MGVQSDNGVEVGMGIVVGISGRDFLPNCGQVGFLPRNTVTHAFLRRKIMLDVYNPIYSVKTWEKQGDQYARVIFTPWQKSDRPNVVNLTGLS
jgi:hypothetical protein